jgi:hypothetical protein
MITEWRRVQINTLTQELARFMAINGISFVDKVEAMEECIPWTTTARVSDGNIIAIYIRFPIRLPYVDKRIRIDHTMKYFIELTQPLGVNLSYLCNSTWSMLHELGHCYQIAYNGTPSQEETREHYGMVRVLQNEWRGTAGYSFVKEYYELPIERKANEWILNNIRNLVGLERVNAFINGFYEEAEISDDSFGANFKMIIYYNHEEVK